MSLTTQQQQELREAGFLEYEVSFFTAEGTKPFNIRTLSWQMAIKHRQDLVHSLLGKGWTLEQITSLLMGHYCNRFVSPWHTIPLRLNYEFVRRFLQEHPDFVPQRDGGRTQ